MTWILQKFHRLPERSQGVLFTGIIMALFPIGSLIGISTQSPQLAVFALVISTFFMVSGLLIGMVLEKEVR